MNQTEHITYDKERIREAIPFPDLVGESVGELTRCGAHYTICCPFHSEKSASFHVFSDHGHCYGCGWHGDIFQFYADWNDISLPVGFGEVLEKLAAKAGVQGTVEDRTGYSPKPYRVESGPKRGSVEARVKPVVPPMRALNTPELMQLARLRGLNALALRIAAQEDKRVGYCNWPQWQQGGHPAWIRGQHTFPSFVVTDAERWCLQYRRLDGGEYMAKGEPAGKARTKGSPKWAIGCAEIGDRCNVLLCEGGTDMLAAYHFLWGFGLLDKVAVVGIMGSSNLLAPDSLEFFRGKRVRIMADADRAKPSLKAQREGRGDKLEEPFHPDTGLPVVPPDWAVPSLEAAKRWTAQLTSVGAAVETFSLYGLSQADGARVGDLNDLARANASTLASEEIGDAFFDWDF